MNARPKTQQAPRTGPVACYSRSRRDQSISRKLRSCSERLG
ncbi:hypothetical protein [Lysobacter gummosus]